MEENTKTTEVVTNEEVGKVDTQSTQKTEEAVKTFTQEEVNSMLKKEKQKAEKEAEYQQKVNEISQLQKENAVLRAGVKDVDDVDYILFKVSKMEGEFEENLAKFLQDNPKYIKGEELTEHKATGAPVKTMGSNETDGVLAILRAKHPEMNI